MEPTVVIIAIVAVIAVFAIANGSNARKREAERAKMKKDAADFIHAATSSKTLKPTLADVRLEGGEVCYYSGPVSLMEARGVSEYSGSLLGVRVTRNISVGSTHGQSVTRDRVQDVDTGTLNVTGKRLIFRGVRSQRIVSIPSIVSIVRVGELVEVVSTEREHTMFLTAANGPILSFVVGICMTVPNPSSFGDQKVPMPESEPNEFDRLVEEGKRTELLARYRARTGASLEDALKIADKAIGKLVL